MPDLGRKYTCYSCHTKFYDLGKPVPVCPKCGADQRDADEAPVYTAPRGRAARIVVEEPPEEEEIAPVAAEATEDGEEGEFVAVEDDREEEVEEEEEY